MTGKVAVGGNNATLAIPSNLTAGNYYFHCAVSVTGIGVFPTVSRTAQVVVNAPNDPNALISMQKNIAYLFYQGTAWQPEILMQKVDLPVGSYDVRIIMKASAEGVRVRPLLCQTPSNSTNYNKPPYYLWNAPNDPNNAISLTTDWKQYRYQITTTAPVSTFQLIPMNGGPNGYIQCSFIGIFEKKGGNYDYTYNYVANNDFSDGTKNDSSWQGIRNNNLSMLGPIEIWDTSLQSAPIPADITPMIKITKQPSDTNQIKNLIMGSLSVSAYINIGGQNSLHYQWYQAHSTVANPSGDTVLSSETNASFAIPKNLMSGTNYYYCIVNVPGIGTSSVISRVATVVVEDQKAILITSQPQSMTVTEGKIIETLAVTAVNNDGGTLGYQWYQALSTTPNPALDTILGIIATISLPNSLKYGTYYFYCVVNSTGVAPAVTSSVAVVTVTYEYNVYYGMLHSHSNYSDGQGTILQAYEYARDVAMLDFFSLADHNHYMIDNPVAMDTLRQAAAAANRSGGFAALAGWEWTNYTIGHMTVVNDPRGNAEYLSISDDVWFSMNKIYGWLSVNDAVAFFNHPGWCDAVGPGEATPYSVEFNHFAYDARVADKIVGMELWNTEVARYGWDTAGFQAYFYDKGYDKSSNGKGFYDDALLKGWRVGAGGSDDTHLVNWGMTTRARLAVLAEELTPVAIYTALQERRFYSTLDHNLSLSFTINGHEMGSVLQPGVHNMLIRANNRNREYFTKVQLYKNGALENTWNIHTQNVEITDELATADGDFYYVKVTQADNDEAISSPIWINTNGK